MNAQSSAVRRFADNPILVPSQVRPSRPDFEVVGVFNPGAIRIGSETVLLLRVAEAPRMTDDRVAAAVFEPDSKRIEVRTWPKDTPRLDTRGPTTFEHRRRNISHVNLTLSASTLD